MCMCCGTAWSLLYISLDSEIGAEMLFTYLLVYYVTVYMPLGCTVYEIPVLLGYVSSDSRDVDQLCRH